MEKGKVLPKSFRITEETSRKFREVTKELDLANQEETLSRLIELYELQKGKETLPEMKETIDTFEEHLRVATSMFLLALENTQNMRALVRTEFESQIKSKDKLIEDLQNTAEKEKKKAADAISGKEELLSQMDALRQEQARQNQHHEQACAEYQEKIQNLKNQMQKMQKNYDELNETYKHFRDASGIIKNELELVRGQLEAARSEKEELAARCETELKRMREQAESVKSENKRLSAQQEAIQKQYEDAVKTSRELEAALSQKNTQLNEQEQAHKQEMEQQKEQMAKAFAFEKEKALFDLNKQLTGEYQQKIAELLSEKIRDFSPVPDKK